MGNLSQSRPVVPKCQLGDLLHEDTLRHSPGSSGAQLDLGYLLGLLIPLVSFSLAETLLNRPQRQKDSSVTLVQPFTICKNSSPL